MEVAFSCNIGIAEAVDTNNCGAEWVVGTHWPRWSHLDWQADLRSNVEHRMTSVMIATTMPLPAPTGEQSAASAGREYRCLWTRV